MHYNIGIEWDVQADVWYIEDNNLARHSKGDTAFAKAPLPPFDLVPNGEPIR